MSGNRARPRPRAASRDGTPHHDAPRAAPRRASRRPDGETSPKSGDRIERHGDPRLAERRRLRRRRRLGWALSVLTIAGATVYLFWPLLSGLVQGQPRYFEWDVPEQYWPDLAYLCESLHEGELPYWNPYDRGGYPYYADPQSAAYHPVGWALCAVAGPSPALGWATVRVVLGFALAGVFGLLWLRRLGASFGGAMVGAVLIEAAPFMRHNWELNLTGAAAYMPLMLWAADRVAVQRRMGDGVLLALAAALCGWVGSPPALWLAGCLTGLYLAFRLGEQARRHGSRALIEALPALGAAAILGVGLLGAVIAPGLRLAQRSVQAGRSLSSIAEGGLHGEELLALVWPRPGNHLYVGWLALALAPAALRRREDRLAWFFVAVAVVAVLMAMGTHGPLFAPAFELVPGVALFRLPHRYEAWLGPASGALAAFALSLPARRTLGGPWARRLRFGAAISASLGIVWLIAAHEAPTPGLFALALAAVLLARTLPRPLDCGAPAWGPLLVALVLADVTRAMPEQRHTRPGPPPGGDEVAARVLPYAAGTEERWRYLDEFAISCRSGTRHRRRDLRGYQDPLQLSSFERVIGSLREHPQLAPQYNVRFALQGPHFIHGWDRHFLPPPDELREALATRVRYRGPAERSVTELTDALPLAYFVPAAEVERASDRSAALQRVRELAPSAVAILDGAADPAAGGRGGPPAGRLGARPRAPPLARGAEVELRPDRLGFAITAPGPGVVVVNEAFYPGWSATVDGQAAPILRANGFVRAVEVPAGLHRIEMRFEPEDGAFWRQALMLGWLAVLLALLAIPLGRRSRRAAEEKNH